jgi:hypothetical protein
VTGDNLSLDNLEIKLAKIESQLKDYESLVSKLKERRIHLSYLIDNYHSIFEASSLEDQNSLFPSEEYDPRKGTKALLVDILKNEARKMKWRDIFSIFEKEKPDIAKSTVRVSLSQMSNDQKFPVKLIKKGNDYFYIYGEKW